MFVFWYSSLLAIKSGIPRKSWYELFVVVFIIKMQLENDGKFRTYEKSSLFLHNTLIPKNLSAFLSACLGKHSEILGQQIKQILECIA